MNILMLNTSESGGGAALAANRLSVALRKCGHNVKTMVMHPSSEPSDFTLTPWYGSRLSKRVGQWGFYLERLYVFARLGFKKQHLWEIDPAMMGTDISRVEVFRQADVVHIHWINQGFLSLDSLEKIIDSHKPIVWTMHDLWPATSLCHYSRSCRKFESDCRQCPLLSRWWPDDWSSRIYKRKKQIYSKGNIHFVACSRWLAEEAYKSVLTHFGRVVNIPNPIDTNQFSPDSKDDARQRMGVMTSKKILLWAAQRVTDPRKGMALLVEALRIIKDKHPQEAQNIAVAILGKAATEAAKAFPVSTIPLGFLSNQQAVVDAYRMADAFILPSTEDNLPNTIMEAMSCGIPAIGFNIGGVPEMIVHKHTGYVAKAHDVNDLSEGILHVLFSYEAQSYGEAARMKTLNDYSEAIVAQRFTELYNQSINERR